jgi:ELWxxDGT repeat protein
MVKDINPGPASAVAAPFASVKNKLYFAADDGAHGYELWTSDGTRKGTVMVKDINPMGDGSVRFPTNVGGTVFFGARDGTHSIELWAFRP